MQNSRKNLRCTRALFLAALWGFSCGGALASSFSYDDQGRLNAATDETGQVAEYVYDPVGNLLQIVRHGAQQPSIISFSPPSGPSGTSVAIIGSGFSPVPAQNAVTFNGTAATTTSATSTSLSAFVPSGATSGPISVTVNGQSAQSGSDFLVAADDGAPVVGDFSPKCVSPGQIVTVVGLNFDQRPNGTRVEIGDQIAYAAATSTTTLTFVAPSRTVGGRIRVTTGRGGAESSEPLTLAAAGLNCTSNWQETGWIAVDAPAANVSLVPSKYVALYFHAQPGDWISVQAFDVTPSSNFFTVEFVSSNGLSHSSVLFGPNRTYSFHLPVIQQAGTYVVRLKGSTATTLNFQLESAQRLTAGSTGTSVHILPRRSRRMAFSANEQSEFGIGVNPVAFSEPGASAWMSTIYTPSGGTVAPWSGSQFTCNQPVINSGCHLIVPPQLDSGTYAFTASANSEVTSDLTFLLSSDVSELLLPGQSRFIQLTEHGQNARLKFFGDAGAGMSVNIADLQMSLGTNTRVYVFDPDNQLLSSAQVSIDLLPAGGKMVTMPFLHKTGLYTMLVSPITGSPATFEATLDPGIPVEIDGNALNVATNLPGKGVRLTVDAQLHDKFGLGLLGLDFDGGSNASINAVVYAPDGSRYGSFSCTQPLPTAVGCEADIGPVPMAGRYAITIEPSAVAPGFHFAIQATSDVSLSSGAGAVERFGGNARLSIEGIPGQGQTISVSNYASTPANTRTWVTVLRPDGVPITSPLYGRLDISGGSGSIKIGDFPMQGVYTAFFDPFFAAKASWSTSISSGVDVQQGQLSIHKSVEPGPWARTTFSAAEGEHFSVGLDINSLTNPTGSYVRLTVFDPNGHALPQRDSSIMFSQCGTSAGGCDFDTPILALAGEYQVWAELPVAKPEDASVQLSVNSDIVINGTTGSFNLAARGQNGQLIFTGIAGQRPIVTVTRISQTGSGRDVDIDVYAPDGLRVGRTTMSGTQTTRSFTLSTLAQSGSHVVYIDPVYGYQTSVNITIE